jgi:formylglycine-generating enzyme required for sulfatase activity
MGSPETEEKRDADETQKQVRIERPFYLGKFEVTQAQWLAVMGENPSQYKTAGLQAPVEKVSWHDCQEFLKKLSTLEGGGRVFRLPTDEEWEYACRAGTSTTVYSGDFTFEDDKCPQLDAIAWYGANSGKTTHPVGQKQANDFGLHDMIGNVWEWTSSWYSAGVRRKVSRGGPFNRPAHYCRAAKRRKYFKQESRSSAFRVVMEIPQ